MRLMIYAKAIRGALIIVFVFWFGLGIFPACADDHPEAWDYVWPVTDFKIRSVPFSEIMSGGPPKDGIPSIDSPIFVDVPNVEGLVDTEPVIGLIVGDEARAYPLRILTYHEIVNDEIGGIPVAVTFCPLCNSSLVLERQHKDRVLDFGTTGMLRHSNLIMYDRQTESWWQQFSGQGIVGAMTGEKLKTLPSRLESWASFRARAPHGQVLVPNNPTMRPYGRNPYIGYDSASFPFLYKGDVPEGIMPMERVIAVDNQAWPMTLVRNRGSLHAGDLFISWQEGQNSALDSRAIADGRDVGNVIVQRLENGEMVDVVHDITFAFVFHAFHPDGLIHIRHK